MATNEKYAFVTATCNFEVELNQYSELYANYCKEQLDHGQTPVDLKTFIRDCWQSTLLQEMFKQDKYFCNGKINVKIK